MQEKLIVEKNEVKSFVSHIVNNLSPNREVFIFLNNGTRLQGVLDTITNDAIVLSNSDINDTKGKLNQLVFFNSIASISF